MNPDSPLPTSMVNKKKNALKGQDTFLGVISIKMKNFSKLLMGNMKKAVEKERWRERATKCHVKICGWTQSRDAVAMWLVSHLGHYDDPPSHTRF